MSNLLNVWSEECLLLRFKLTLGRAEKHTFMLASFFPVILQGSGCSHVISINMTLPKEAAGLRSTSYQQNYRSLDSQQYQEIIATLSG